MANVSSLGESNRSGASAEISGVRFQLRSVLNRIYHGDELLYRFTPIESGMSSERLLGTHFVSEQIWHTHNLVPHRVPGTVSPNLIGKMLLSFDWCEPSIDQGMGYLRRFTLNERGIKAMHDSNEWWGALSYFEKFMLALSE
jgi:hypothetical protein